MVVYGIRNLYDNAYHDINLVYLEDHGIYESTDTADLNRYDIFVLE